MAFEIRYGLSGGFGGAGDWEPSDALTQNAANRDAYEMACQEYNSYAGMHGLRDYSAIMEDEGVDEDEAEEIWMEERAGWLEYQARPVQALVPEKGV